jgi:acyl-CoA thioester hydrolase
MTHTLRVRFAETDQMGIAHHSSYVIWMEAARVDWLRQQGMSYKAWEESGVSLAVSKIEIEYRAAATFDDEITIETNLIEAKSRKFCFEYKIYRDTQLLATGKSIHTPTEKSGKAIRLPEEWLRKLEPLVNLQIAKIY